MAAIADVASFILENAVIASLMPRYTLLRKALGTNGVVTQWVKCPFALITSLRVLLGLQPLTTTAYSLRVYLAGVVCQLSRMASCFISSPRSGHIEG